MAANPPIGNNALEGVLGVVDVYFDGVYMGKTTADTEIVPEEDNKDILFSQTGTKPDDKIPTGISYMVNATFGEITGARIEKLQRGFDASAFNSGKFGRDIYVSRRENAKELKLIRVDSEGVASTDPAMQIVFYKASPEITGTLLGYGPDLQRNIPCSFYLFYDNDEKAFGYYGNASSMGLTPVAA
jgi:hypothetical protein